MRQIFLSIVLLAMLTAIGCDGNGDGGANGGTLFESANDDRGSDSRTSFGSGSNSRGSGSRAFGSGERMTVEEYAAACAGLEDQFSGLSDIGPSDIGDAQSFEEFADTLPRLRDLVNELESWNPPDELERLHEARVGGIDSVITTLEDLIDNTDIVELMREVEKAEQDEDVERMLELAGEMAPLIAPLEEMEAEIESHDAKIAAAEDALPMEIYDILSEADCL